MIILQVKDVKNNLVALGLHLLTIAHNNYKVIHTCLHSLYESFDVMMLFAFLLSFL